MDSSSAKSGCQFLPLSEVFDLTGVSERTGFNKDLDKWKVLHITGTLGDMCNKPMSI